MEKKPDKVIGPEGKQAKMFITKYEGGRQASKIIIDAGFNWTESIKPHLPGCPDWCPATHFGGKPPCNNDLNMSYRTHLLENM